MNKARRAALKYFPDSNIKSTDLLDSALVRKYKITVFVPLRNADKLAFRMSSKGAGRIGNYSRCSFRVTGIGTFIGDKKSNPALGQKGKFEKVEETRLEMICDEADLRNVLDIVYSVHPYEEPACDVYEVLVRDKKVNSRITEVVLKKSVTAAGVLMRMNSGISPDMFPDILKRTRIKRIILDESESEENRYPSAKLKTLCLRKRKKEIKIEII